MRRVAPPHELSSAPAPRKTEPVPPPAADVDAEPGEPVDWDAVLAIATGEAEAPEDFDAWAEQELVRQRAAIDSATASIDLLHRARRWAQSTVRVDE